MEINSIKLSNQNNKKLFKLLICPYCWKRIPLLTLTKKEGKFYLCIDCFCLTQIQQMELSTFLQQIRQHSKPGSPNTCSYSTSHQGAKASQYCVNCQKWLCSDCYLSHQNNNSHVNHLITSKELTLTIGCNTHEKDPDKININNKQMNQTICSKCNSLLYVDDIFAKAIDDFSFAKITMDSSSITNKDVFEKIDSSIQRNKELKDTIIDLIQQKVIQLETMKEDIIKYYQINDSINQEMRRLIAFICGTYDSIKQNPIYDKFVLLKKNIEYFKYNNSNIEINADNVYASSQMILKHFKDSYVLITNPIDEVLIGHSDQVISFAQVSNEQLASGSADSTIKLWDLTLLKCVSTLQGHQDITKLIQFNSTHLISGAKDGEILLWNLSNNTISQTFKEHEQTITGLVKISDTKFASSSSDCHIKMWVITQPQCIMSVKAHNEEISSLIALKDSKLISASFDLTIKFWNSSNMKSDYTLSAHQYPVSSLAYLRSGTLVSGSFKQIKLWNIRKMISLGAIQAHSSYIHILKKISETLFASGSNDQLIKIWDSTSLKCNRSIESHCGELMDIVILRGSNYYLASGTGSNSIELFKKKSNANSQIINSKANTNNKTIGNNCLIY